MSEVRLVQSGMFPNVWSIVGVDGDGMTTFRDPMFANGAMAAENAVTWARECGHTIVRVDITVRDIVDPRTGRKVDGAEDVIAGIEYRSGRPVVEVTA